MTLAKIMGWFRSPLPWRLEVRFTSRPDANGTREVWTIPALARALAPAVAGLDRPIKLMSVAVCCAVFVAILDLAFDQGHLVWRFFTPKHGEGPEWRDLFQALLLVFGLPIGLMLWHWRDLSVRQQLENARKDTTLKEFSELQLRAAGAIDEKLPFGARVALQVAALHQLRPYLRGEYGPSFRLGAFELVLSILDGRVRDASRDSEEEGTPDIAQASIVPRRVHQAVRDIVYEEWKHVFTEGTVFTRRSLKDLRLPDFALLERIDFIECDLSGASFAEVDLNGCRFTNSTLDRVSFRAAEMKGGEFEKCEMSETNFVDARLHHTRIGHCDLSGSDWHDAVLRGTQLHHDNLGKAYMEDVLLQNAVVYRCNLEGADLRNAQVAYSAFGAIDWSLPLVDGFAFDADTVLGGELSYDEPSYPPMDEQLRVIWAEKSEEERDQMRSHLYENSASRDAPNMSRLDEPIQRSSILF